MDSRKKSSIDEIRTRFDRDVERFSNLATGQTATMDAVLAMELISQSAAHVTPAAKKLIDVGCGAGNFSLKILEALPDLDVSLIDLSRPMLDRACERVSNMARGSVSMEQGDI